MDINKITCKILTPVKRQKGVTGLKGDNVPLLASTPKTLHSLLIQGNLWERELRNPPHNTTSQSNEGTSPIRAQSATQELAGP